MTCLENTKLNYLLNLWREFELGPTNIAYVIYVKCMGKISDSHDLTFFGDYVSVTIYTIIIGLLFQSFIQCDINMDLKLSV